MVRWQQSAPTATPEFDGTPRVGVFPVVHDLELERLVRDVERPVAGPAPAEVRPTARREREPFGLD